MTTPLRLMTFNLRVSAADDGPNHWLARWPHVKAMLNEVEPDIFGAQECMPNQLAALSGELYGYFGYSGPDTMVPGFALHNPVFVCDRCLTLPIRQGVFALNETGVIGQKSWDSAESRLAHWLRFDGWTLVNTHLDHKGEQARLESARLIVDFLRDTPAAIVMGDFNCLPDAPPLQHFLAHGFRMAKDALPPDVDRRTFHDFTGAPVVELDYVLVRGDVQVTQASIPRPRRESPYLSDHDPLVVDVVIG